MPRNADPDGPRARSLHRRLAILCGAVAVAWLAIALGSSALPIGSIPSMVLLGLAAPVFATLALLHARSGWGRSLRR